ncbi:MAG TPA: DNA methyltransferase [Acidimicrobiales bacterium]|jgi:hypothetical protein
MKATFIVADVFDGLRSLPDASVDLVCTSPPFLALRSYLPPDHPDKAKELGSEATPAEWLDGQLAVVAEVGRVLAPHGSICWEIGDTYAGSGGGGGDYLPGGMREGQQQFAGSAASMRESNAAHWRAKNRYKDGRGNPDGMRDTTFSGANTQTGGGVGWPLAKSLTGLPTLFAWSLAYGRNLLTGEPSPAGHWRVRNLRPWVRPNPPVGALRDKVRPATSYVTVACRSQRRWHDLDAVRRPLTTGPGNRYPRRPSKAADVHGAGWQDHPVAPMDYSAGAPPLDWQHPVDEVLRAQLATDRTTPRDLRLALERAGIIDPIDGYDLSPGGYTGAHYAVWPPELVAPMVEEMCPRRVCRTCGEPSRRLVNAKRIADADNGTRRKNTAAANPRSGFSEDVPEVGWEYDRTTVGWSSCGCPGMDDELWGDNDWRGQLRGCNAADKAARRAAAEATKAERRGDADAVRLRAAADEAASAAAGEWRCLAAMYRGCPDGRHARHGWRPGVVLDPFAGTGTTLRVAVDRGRDAVGIDIDARNADLARQRLGLFLDVGFPASSEEGEVA